MSELTDDDKFPFGKYRDSRMADVPAEYYDYLRDQPWIGNWPRVLDYIERHAGRIDKALEE